MLSGQLSWRDEHDSTRFPRVCIIAGCRTNVRAEITMLTLSESDLMYLLTLLRSNDQPMTTSDLVHALQERARK